VCAEKEDAIQQQQRFEQVWAIVFFSFLSFSKVSVLMERWSEIHGI
jgi:hypothetical protein